METQQWAVAGTRLAALLPARHKEKLVPFVSSSCAPSLCHTRVVTVLSPCPGALDPSERSGRWGKQRCCPPGTARVGVTSGAEHGWEGAEPRGATSTAQKWSRLEAGGIAATAGSERRQRSPTSARDRREMRGPNSPPSPQPGAEPAAGAGRPAPSALRGATAPHRASRLRAVRTAPRIPERAGSRGGAAGDAGGGGAGGGGGGGGRRAAASHAALTSQGCGSPAPAVGT